MVDGENYWWLQVTKHFQHSHMQGLSTLWVSYPDLRRTADLKSVEESPCRLATYLASSEKNEKFSRAIVVLRMDVSMVRSSFCGLGERI
jgi:plasmid replication initiation protein